MDISKVDKNFKVETNLNKSDIKFYDCKAEPFKIYGVFYEDGKFRRMPEAVASTVNGGVKGLHSNTAGGRVRFKTNSSYVAISTKIGTCRMPHMAYTGSMGFDLYIKKNGEFIYINTYKPTVDVKDGFEGVIELGDTTDKEILINMPLYGNVNELYVGLNDDAYVAEPETYAIEKPIVYYGSSITQGGCASRPGTSYQALISSKIDCDYINLGFSGNAKGEDEMAEYIANLDMSMFVYDYDHNAPTLEHLEKTHERMFKIIREKNPNLPIIMLSRPKYRLTDDEEKRFEIIEKTYKNAKANGDHNVYLIKGTKLMEIARFEGTVDNCHPNDLGFYSMAQALIPEIKDILKI